MQQVATAIMENALDLRGNLHRVTLRLGLRYRRCMFATDSHDSGVVLRNVAERLRTRFCRVSIDLWQLAGKRFLLQ